MTKKVTTLDISKRLGLSRNTVSKALNRHPGIPEETRRRVIEQAAAMGYKKLPVQLPESSESAPARKGTIAYVTRSRHHLSSYWMNVLNGVEQVVSKQGFELKLGFIKKHAGYSDFCKSGMNACQAAPECFVRLFFSSESCYHLDR